MPMRVKDLNTAGKAIYVESAEFEIHFENVGPKNNKLYVVDTKSKAVVVPPSKANDADGDSKANDADGNSEACHGSSILESSRLAEFECEISPG